MGPLGRTEGAVGAAAPPYSFNSRVAWILNLSGLLNKSNLCQWLLLKEHGWVDVVGRNTGAWMWLEGTLCGWMWFIGPPPRRLDVVGSVPDRRCWILKVVIVRRLITWVLGIWRGEELGKGFRKGRSVYKQPETKVDGSCNS